MTGKTVRGPQLVLALLVGAAWLQAGRAVAADPNEAVIRAVEQVLPAVVDIHVQAPPETYLGRVLGAERRGTGVVVDREGHILTASHVVIGAGDLRVTYTDGTEQRATIAGVDSDSGLAVLTPARAPKVTPVELGSSAGLRLGQLAVVISSEGGKERVVSAGIVGALRPFVGYWEYLLERAIQTDAAINPGSSGGPLVDARGRVIGVMSFSIREAQGRNIAIPVELYAAVREELLRHGRVLSRPPRPWLGIYAVDGRGAVMIAQVRPGGPAERGGLEARDQVLEVNGIRVSSMEEFYRELWKGRVGGPMAIRIRRGQDIRTVTVRPGDRHDSLRD
ncbi:MAG: serine protease [Deltaproteobacteria bacterium]|nr:serine protease [Deltaproteobacteria bacterium]